jgi:hypothetical protein
MKNFRSSSQLVIAALVTLLAAANSFGATLHVTMSGDDAAPGTSEAPLRTFQKADQALRLLLLRVTPVFSPGPRGGASERYSQEGSTHPNHSNSTSNGPRPNRSAGCIREYGTFFGL